MKWDTFWGKCYPGWHIECSAMSRKYLGELFDIHTGGIDHIPIHHENEIAQSKGYSGHIPANWWMHCEFLLVDGGKMSLESAKTALFRLKDGYQKHAEGSEDVDDSVINEYETKFHEAINDDLNMPQAMSVVWDVIKNPIKSKKFAELLRKFDQVLGVKIDEKEEIELPKEIEDIIEERKQARTDKDWNKSDELRDKLFDLGYVVKDTKNGMEVTLK